MKIWTYILAWFLGCIMAASGLWGQSAAPAGQTTPPAEFGWPKLVTAYAYCLTQANVQTDMPAPTQLTRLEAQAPADWLLLQQRGGKATLLGAHGYIYPPLVLAADLAADFKNAANVPEEIKKRMIPEDEAVMQRANAVAVQWIGQALDAKPGDLVGVIVLWTNINTDTPRASRQLLFVLFKGSTIGQQFQVDQCVWGFPEHVDF